MLQPIVRLDHEFRWRIENFSCCPHKTEKTIESPNFRSVRFDEAEWKAVLAPRGDGDERYVGLWLKRLPNDSGPTELPIQVDFSLIDIDGKEHFNRSLKRSFKKRSVLGFAYFVERDKLFKDRARLLPKDVLTVHFKLFTEDKMMATETYMRTTLDTERSSFFWMLNDFKNWKKDTPKCTWVMSNMFAPGFTAYGRISEQSTAKTEPHSTKDDKLMLQLSIKPHKPSENDIFMSLVIGVQRDVGHSVRPITNVEHFFKKGSIDEWFVPSIDTSLFTEFVRETCDLTLSCEVATTNCKPNTTAEKFSIPVYPLRENFRSSCTTLVKDIGSALNSQRVSPDVILRVDGEQLPAHKLILSARSNVFRKALIEVDVKKKWVLPMFFLNAVMINYEDTPVPSSESGITVSAEDSMDYVDIAGVDLATMKQVLKCMYKDTLDPLNFETAKTLYRVGVKYEFWLLQDKCEKYLASSLSTETVFQTLHFADANGIECLKTEALDFIAMNKGYILLTDGWQDFLDQNVELGKSTLQYLRDKRKKAEVV